MNFFIFQVLEKLETLSKITIKYTLHHKTFILKIFEIKTLLNQMQSKNMFNNVYTLSVLNKSIFFKVFQDRMLGSTTCNVK